MRLLLSLNLPNEVVYIPMLRRVSRDALASFHVPSRDLDDIELLVGELATNAVRHAHAPHYNVAIELYNDCAVVVVTDTGKGFDRNKLPPPGTPRADSQETGAGSGERIGGWGLPLVEMIADKVEIAANVPGGTIVRAQKHITLKNAP